MKRIRLYRAAALLLALVMAFPVPAAASGGEGTAFSVKLEDQMVTLGTPGTLTAAVTPPAGVSDSRIEVTWTTNDTAQRYLRLVTADGGDRTMILDPVSIGTVMVTATATVRGTSQSTSASCQVSVGGAPATGIRVEREALVLDVGQNVEFSSLVSPNTADATNVEWSLTPKTDDDEGSVSIPDPPTGQSIRVTGVRPGEMDLFAKVPGTDLSAKCQVLVRGVRISDAETSNLESLTLRVGLSRQLAADPIGNIGTLETWKSNNEHVAYVNPSSGLLTAQTPGTTSIEATIGGYTTSVEVTVVENTANVIETSAEAGMPMALSDLRSQLQECSVKAFEESENQNTDLYYLSNLSVSPSQGVLYHSYVSGDSTGDGVGNERYYMSDSIVGQRHFSDVTFIPNADFSGTATISYYGFNNANQFFVGTIRVSVRQGSDVTYTVGGSTPLHFLASDFSNVCKDRNGKDFRYVSFDPPAARYGTLYYNYQDNGTYTDLVNSTTRYTQSQSAYMLDNVAFVAAEGFTGTVRIGYQGVDTSGRAFSGRVTIVVSDLGSSTTGDVTYTSTQRQRVALKASDFNSVCRKTIGGTLSYIRFSQMPAAAEGVLYYNYSSNGTYDSRANTSTRYYRTGSPGIGSLSFVPAANASGTVTIPFTGYNQSGEQFTGTLRIRVTGSGGFGEVTYTAQAGYPLSFEAADFNEASLRATSNRLNYVRFEQPNANYGTLYYNYRSASSTGTKVTESRQYTFSNGSYSISNVSFVPRSTFVGTVEVPFYGVDVDGVGFDGVVTIRVEDGGSADLRYSVASGGQVSFRASDFNSASYAVTGDALDYVRFTLPSSSRGTLYYGRSGSNNGSRVSASTSYYRSGSTRPLDSVSFEASASYTGTFNIAFTGWSTGGRKFEGNVEIEVKAPTASTIRYLGSALPIALRSADFSSASTSLLGRDLSYIRFTQLPAASQGQLLLGYSGPTAAATAVSAGTSYYLTKSPQLGQISFVPKAGYEGQVSIPFTGTDTAGKSFSGVVEITLSNSFAGSSFTDLAGLAWAAPSVEYLYQYGIVSGIGNSQYGPRLPIRRGDFVLMLTRAFQLRGSGGTASFADVPASSYYAQAVATAKELGIVRGNENSLFQPAGSLTRQDAMVMIQRAMQAAGRSLPSGATSALYGFSDRGQLASYAQDAAAALVAAGVVQGGGDGLLRPRSSISRAEMAVILHRAITQ
ncbi:MAG: S-layer homology domain-containing protein [Oscillospiraceae bacterium]|nr:S-layer homology domain-containing protein [Oscillospiraceae bacterium]